MRFEGSYMGATGKISAQAVMECKICWTVYDPAKGDETRQIDPGTPFFALPPDWSCPTCSAPPGQFLVLSDPGSPAAAEAAEIAQRTTALEADFREVWHTKMRDVPLVNKLLTVKAVGFRLWEGRPLGVLIAPWFMNLVLLPTRGEDWSMLRPGEKETIAFPSGEYEFTHNVRELTGGYKACSLFSPMGEFGTQAGAEDVAGAVMIALFDEGNRDETDRSAEIRTAAAGRSAPDVRMAAPTRRTLISAGLAGG
jgi:[NiFe] hydrogenase assembly HybE family chaperone